MTTPTRDDERVSAKSPFAGNIAALVFKAQP
jgi:hypothetical protein